MSTMAIGITNVCNLECIHCLRDKLENKGYIALNVFKSVVDQIAELGIERVSLTGGEPTIHPDFGQLLGYLAEKGVEFNFVTNGWNFKEKVLPIVLDPTIKRYLKTICFSLDGASAETHDALRRDGSFREVIKAANLCRLKGIPLSIKTVVTNINKNELTDIMLLGASLETTKHHFIALTPTSRAIKEGIVPSIADMRAIFTFITGSLIPAAKVKINTEGSWGVSTPVFNCNAYRQVHDVDYLGNLIFCCNLSHVHNGEKPYEVGKELLVDLKDKTLAEGIVEHYRVLAEFTKQRLKDASNKSPLAPFPCWWCLRYFSKLRWVEEYPESEMYQLIYGKRRLAVY